jgi:hypothetical protein
VDWTGVRFCGICFESVVGTEDVDGVEGKGVDCKVSDFNMGDVAEYVPGMADFTEDDVLVDDVAECVLLGFVEDDALVDNVAEEDDDEGSDRLIFDGNLTNGLALEESWQII